MSKFYTFVQNNSGGSFVYDPKRGITHFVIIEASTPEEANERAKTIGLYFDGEGDCPCCGNRWYAVSEEADGDKTPMIYEQSLKKFAENEPVFWIEGGYEAVVHYTDGRIEWHAPDPKGLDAHDHTN